MIRNSSKVELLQLKSLIHKINALFVLHIFDNFHSWWLFSESAIRFLDLQIKKKIFQKTILSLKFELVVYYYWREI